MRLRVYCSFGLWVLACTPPKKNPVNIGLTLPQSGAVISGELFISSARLAAEHVVEGGGLRGNDVLAFVEADTATTTAGGQAAVEKVISESQVVAALMVSSSETIGVDPTTKMLIGGGPAAAAAKIPLFCIGCSAPDFDAPLVQAGLGAQTSGTDPTGVNASQGTVEAPGYVYRGVETSATQGIKLAQMAAEAGVNLAAGVKVNLSFGTALIDGYFKKVFTDPPPGGVGKTYAGTFAHAPSAAAAMLSEADFKASVATAMRDAIASLGGQTTDAAVVVNTFPANINDVAPEYAAAAAKPKLFFSFTGYSSDVLTANGASLVGARGVAYAIARGPSPGTFVTDYATIAGVPEDQVTNSIFTDVAYDAIMMLAIAIYKTGKEQPTGEEIKAALDTLSDPNGEKVGYREFKKARELVDAGTAINYSGVSGELDFDVKNGVKSTLLKWEIEDQGGNFGYKELP